jgi:hypothetical protein
MLAIVLGSGCEKAKPPGDAGSPPEAALPVEPWMSQPAEQWPQFVLTNSARFKNSTPLAGASAFLVKAPGGKVFAATARHLLGENGGVEPPVPRSKLDGQLEKWILFPRTARSHVVEVGSFPISLPEKSQDDWLLLSVKEAKGELPATPLKLRRKPVAIGERVHLVGVAYAEPTVRQKVYTGKVTQRGHGTRFRYDIDPPVNIQGFSGAPIIDDAGYVVGVMTVWFNARKQGDQYLEAGGEDAAVVFNEFGAP